MKVVPTTQSSSMIITWIKKEKKFFTFTKKKIYKKNQEMITKLKENDKKIFQH